MKNFCSQTIPRYDYFDQLKVYNHTIKSSLMSDLEVFSHTLSG